MGFSVYVNPARAGMILITRIGTADAESKPRASGDDPANTPPYPAAMT